MTRKQLRVMLAVAILEFGNYAAPAVITPFFPKEAEKKGISLSMSGVVFFIYSFMVFIMSPFSYIFLSRVEPRTLLIIALLINGFIHVAFGFLDQIQSKSIFTILCILCRGMSGVCSAMQGIVIIFVGVAFPQNINTAVGILEAFPGIATCLAPLIGGILYDLGSFGCPFWFIGGYFFLAIPVALICLPRLPRQQKNSESVGKFYWKFVKSPLVVLNLWAIFVFSTGLSFMEPIIEPAMRHTFGASSTTVGLLLFGVFFGYTVSNPLTGWLADRIKRRKWVLILLGCCGTGVSLIFIGGSSPILNIPDIMWVDVVALVVDGFSTGMGYVPTYGILLDDAIGRGFADDSRTVAIIFGALNSVYALGDFLGPLLGSIISDYFSFGVTCTIMALLFFFTAACVFLVHCGRSCMQTSATPIPDLLFRTNLTDESVPLLYSPTAHRR